jgi:uncharacterized membrane protein
MNAVAAFGRILFAAAIVGFGIQHFITGFSVVGVEVVPTYPPSHLVWGWIVASLLVLCGLCIAFRWIPIVACFVLTALFVDAVAVIDVPRVLPKLMDLTERTRLLETVCLAAGSLIIAGLMAKGSRSSGLWRALQLCALVATWLFAVSTILFGVTHFLVLAFIASLVPKWIPWHMFWAWFTAVAFVVVGLAFIVRIAARPAAFLLGLMFLSWVAVLHGPRIYAAMNSVAEWNSGLVALGMAGCSFALCGSTAIRRGA